MIQEIKKKKKWRVEDTAGNDALNGRLLQRLSVRMDTGKKKTVLSDSCVFWAAELTSTSQISPEPTVFAHIHEQEANNSLSRDSRSVDARYKETLEIPILALQQNMPNKKKIDVIAVILARLWSEKN